jgi:hypothetical protein
MNKITKNIAAIIAFGIGTTTIGFAQITQQKIGNNPTLINSNAALEIESTNKGFLLPRLQLTAINNFAPLSAHVAGMTVYNTATAGTAPNNVTPGYYFNNGTQWVRIATGSDFSANEPWYIQNTTNQATANNQPIYQNQKVGVGNFGSGISTKQFEVKGDFKAEASDGTAIFGTEVNSPLVPPSSQNVANYWVNAAGDYRVNVVHANAAAISAGTEGTNPNAGIESIIAVDTDRATVGSRFKDLSAKSEMRMDKTGNFFLEAFDTAPANNYGATVSLLNDGLRLVHSTTQGAGANWLSNNNWSEILVRKEEGVKFEFKNATGTTKAGYWFPTTTGTDGQVMTQTASGKMVWSTISTATTNALTNTTNTITSVVNGVTATAPAVNTVSNTVSGGNISTTVNGVAGTGVAITNALSSSANTLSSTVAGGTARTASIINTNVLALSGTNLTSTINGITSNILNLTPAITAATTNTLTATNGNLVSTVNGVATTPAVPVLISASNGLTATNGNVKLGGTLAQATTIATVNGATTHALNITGLPTGAATDNVVVSSTDGQLKTITTANLVREPWYVIGSLPAKQATSNTDRIYQMGNVAVGASTIPSITVGATTVNPKFHVAGDVSITGKYYTTNSVYADYVFEKYFKGNSDINPTYEFKSLNYVKDFIKANHHLPGVESIVDLAKSENGYTFDMTKLTVQSLEKIEELYIHTIEQQDLINKQAKELDELKARMDHFEKLLLNKK